MKSLPNEDRVVDAVLELAAESNYINDQPSLADIDAWRREIAKRIPTLAIKEHEALMLVLGMTTDGQLHSIEEATASMGEIDAGDVQTYIDGGLQVLLDGIASKKKKKRD